jgi:hypothetical protein
MSQYLRVLCRSEESLSRAELGGFIREGYFFDEPPRFVPALEDPEAAHPGWERFEVHPPGSTRPIVLHHAAHSVLRDSVEEIVQTLLDASLGESHAPLIQRIRASRQLITFELEPSQMTEDAWEMLDATEACVARLRDGVVFVSGEGVYDAALHPLCKLTRPASE